MHSKRRRICVPFMGEGACLPDSRSFPHLSGDWMRSGGRTGVLLLSELELLRSLSAPFRTDAANQRTGPVSYFSLLALHNGLERKV
ncbi:hypothetical protein CDAR_501791 [Caerostris darwini]|uniref:Uncharacterized protein n=1 Tax=Caerostris darwini TaxID=1538125 RepID=A0AAV4TT93_9ARAC|nr:hypothetical protein CDAR_501791 [Caerostris darwini]